MASFDYPSPLSLSPKKRSRNDFDPLSLSGPLPKRLCPEPEQASPHLSFLEELCDFEASLDTSALVSSTQEELVAEMMKSLEKVIEDREDALILHDPSLNQASSEPSSSLATPEPSASALYSSSNLATPEPSTSALDPSWQYTQFDEGQHVFHEEPAGCNYGELDFECGQSSEGSDEGDCRDAQIRHLLEASDDELGIPVACRAFCDEALLQREDEWALLDQAAPGMSDENLHAHALAGLLDGAFHQFEDSFSVVRELSEGVTLF